MEIQIAQSFSLLYIIIGMFLIAFGLGFVGWILAVFVQRFQDEEGNDINI